MYQFEHSSTSSQFTWNLIVQLLFVVDFHDENNILNKLKKYHLSCLITLYIRD